MINFKQLPIYLHQPSQLDLDDIGPMCDGLHYYVNMDCNAAQYMQLYNAILGLLDISVNADSTGGAGTKYPFDLSNFPNEYELQMTDGLIDRVYASGINPITQRFGSVVCLGNKFVYKEKSYPFRGMQGTITGSYDNLNVFAHRYGAYVSDELQKLTQQHRELVHQITELDKQIAGLQLKEPGDIDEHFATKIIRLL